MRTYQAAINLLGLIRKKEKINSPSSETLNSTVICSGDNWEASEMYKPGAGIVHLVHNNKAYVFESTGNSGTFVHIYDGTRWEIIQSDIPVITNYRNISFTAGNKGYLGSLQGDNSFYEYDFNANTWTRKANFPGPGVERQGAATFAIGNKGYVVGGEDLYNNTIFNDTWEYNAATDCWIQRASLPLPRAFGSGFSIGNKGYVVNGYFYLGGRSSLAEYNPSTDSWSFKAIFPGAARIDSQIFVIAGKAYVGGGIDNNHPLQDFYRYDPGNDSWIRVADIPVLLPLHNSFSINSKGYVVYLGSSAKMKKYNPVIRGLSQW